MATFAIGLLVMMTFQFGASLVSGAAAIKDYRLQYTQACEFYDRLNAEVQVSVALLQRVQESAEVASTTSELLSAYAGRVQSMRDGLQAQQSPYQRTLMISTIAQAVGAMLMIYVLVKSKERRDSILNFL